MQLFKNRGSAEKWFSSDKMFNQLYPENVRNLARLHWTPLNVARAAAGFLAAEDNTRILDIGSGVGKFCFGAAYYQPKAIYYGVEQRKSLLSHAETIRQMLHLDNVKFICGNFTQLDFRDFDHFYFYNAFSENLPGTDKIDDSIDYSAELYNYYNRYLYKQLESKPAGTRLVTFQSLEDEVPQGFHIIDTAMDKNLKFWLKA